MKDVITFGGSGFLDSLAMLGPCPSSSARYLRDSLTNLLIALKLHLLLLLDSRISANNFSPLPKQLTSNTYSCNPMTHPPIKLVLESLFTKKKVFFRLPSHNSPPPPLPDDEQPSSRNCSTCRRNANPNIIQQIDEINLHPSFFLPKPISGGGRDF